MAMVAPTTKVWWGNGRAPVLILLNAQLLNSRVLFCIESSKPVSQLQLGVIGACRTLDLSIGRNNGRGAGLAEEGSCSTL